MTDWCLEVWGDYACFTRPEMKVERVSYDVMTPSAARAIYESILWKPAIIWHITSIEVLNPIKWISVRRNEVGKIASAPGNALMQAAQGGPLGIYIEESRQQRAGYFLRDVRYRLHAWFEFIPPEKRGCLKGSGVEIWADKMEEEQTQRMDEKEAKYAAMFDRRAGKGQCFHRPYLGCREFACDFKLIKEGNSGLMKPVDDSRELGWMLYDMDFSDPEHPQPMFFNARLDHGVLNTDIRKAGIEVRR